MDKEKIRNDRLRELPFKADGGTYEIRLESIGGLGANLCGKLLGELGAEYLGVNASSFSSYGSEKRGSPVKGYVRYCPADREILRNSPVERPDLLALFHFALASAFPVTMGVDEDCIIVVNTSESAEVVRDALRLYGGEIWCVDALDIALRCKSRVNMVMLGAIARASGFIPLESVTVLVGNTLGRKYPNMLESNLDGVKQGYERVTVQKFMPDGKYEKLPYREARSDWGYANAPMGGMNPHIGSMFSNETSASREGYIPLFIPEKCIHCGLCDSTCPDMVFQFTEGEYRGRVTMMNRGLDYLHCKGCLRCVDICPVEALVAGKEQEHPKKKYFVRNKDLIAENIRLDAEGADPYITGEAYLDEKTVDGGLV